MEYVVESRFASRCEGLFLLRPRGVTGDEYTGAFWLKDEGK